MSENHKSHPYIPNSAPAVVEKMLAQIGASSIEELYQTIPQDLRIDREMDMPPALESEYQLTRHMNSLLKKNKSGQDCLCFAGAGCAMHYVPAICDEINQRSEFLTAYAGEPYEDLGRFQALFEYASMLGELVECEAVNIPTYDWNQAAATSIRMAHRITKRDQILISELIDPDRLSTIENYCRSALEIVPVKHDSQTGLIDLADLKAKLSPRSAGFYFETPSFVGTLETQVAKIADLVRQAGGISIAGVDPISLGVVNPPAVMGVDITCGDLQPLGIHMNSGGGQAGFIATADDPIFVQEYPSRLFGISKTVRAGEWGFGDILFDDRTSFGARENGKEFVGTASALWGITAGVYLALMGPTGMSQLGETIIANANYAKSQIAKLPGVSVRNPQGAIFKEFVVDFAGAPVTSTQAIDALFEQDIIAGVDLTGKLTGYENCMLICVTEIHTSQEIDQLTAALSSILK